MTDALYPFVIDGDTPITATYKDKVRWQLFNSGLFERDIDGVIIPSLIASFVEQNNQDLLKVLGENYQTYPIVVYFCLWYEVKKVVLSWIDSTKPKAWFREMFV